MENEQKSKRYSAAMARMKRKYLLQKKRRNAKERCLHLYQPSSVMDHGINPPLTHIDSTILLDSEFSASTICTHSVLFNKSSEVINQGLNFPHRTTGLKISVFTLKFSTYGLKIFIASVNRTCY